MERDRLYAHYCDYYYKIWDDPQAKIMSFEEFIKNHNKKTEKIEESFHEIEYEFGRQKRTIKVPSYTKEKYLNPIRLVEKIILDLRKFKNEHHYMAIENIFIYDKDNKVVRVAKQWG